jgi:hypothetical protein
MKNCIHELELAIVSGKPRVIGFLFFRLIRAFRGPVFRSPSVGHSEPIWGRCSRGGQGFLNSLSSTVSRNLYLIVFTSTSLRPLVNSLYLDGNSTPSTGL